MSNKGLFISIEGVEGVGKSTAIQFIQQQLDKHNISYVLTREPGGTKIAEAIRQILLNPSQEKMCVDTELLLMFAGRAQNVSQVIKPGLAAGKWVLCDRFTDASFAYQGGGRGIPEPRIAQLAEWVLEGLKPDLTFLLDAPVEVGFDRIKERGAHDRIEQESLEFFKRIRQVYLKRANEDPKRFRIIQADISLFDVQHQLMDVLKPLIDDEYLCK
jgi:dTMP kinase